MKLDGSEQSQRCAADYLQSIKPNRYYWCRYDESIHLIDRLKPSENHLRQVSKDVRVQVSDESRPLYTCILSSPRVPDRILKYKSKMMGRV